jgi:hypothetical protein
MNHRDTDSETTVKINRTKIRTHHTLASRSNRGAAADAASICRRPLGAHEPWRVAL